MRLGHIAKASITIDDLDTQPTLHYATKWVSPDGDDVTGDGSEASPWKSLQHAADQVGPGDFVFVKPGKYWGMNLTTDGKPDARITFYAFPGVEIDEPYPGQMDGINLEGADFITIEGFHIHDMPRAGLRTVNNQGVILRGNHSDHNVMWGILSGWSENLVVENNLVSNSQVEHGIYISNSSDGAIVRNNRVWGNHDSGIQFNADRFLPGDGVHSHNLIENNIIFDNGLGGGAAINLDGVQDSVIQNNLLYDNHATGIVLYLGQAADGSKRNLVANNTVVMAPDARWALLMNNDSSENILVNNIFLNQNPQRGSFTIDHSSLPAYSNHNLLQNLFQLDGSNTPYAHWQSFSHGMDAQSIVIDQSQVLTALNELFVDFAQANFELNPDSFAINAGTIAVTTQATLPSLDLYRNPRASGGMPDLGALEHQFASPVKASYFTWKHYVGYESSGVVEIMIQRQGDVATELELDVVITPQSASIDDYKPVSQRLKFAPGESFKTFPILLVNDNTIEDIESIELQLKSVPSIDTSSPPSENEILDLATLHLVSDDAWNPGSIEFDSASIAVDESADSVSITVHRSNGSDGNISVAFESLPYSRPKQPTWIQRHTAILYPTDQDVAATAGMDYQTVKGTLNFSDGELSKTIQIPIMNDNWFESPEAFLLRLTSPTHGASIGARDELKVRIVSDDVKAPGAFEFLTPQYAVTEGTPSVEVTVLRTGGANVESSVSLYHTGAGNQTTLASAWSPSDYGLVPQVITFAPGEASKTISIPIVDDQQMETSEAFSIELFAPTNDATIGAQNKTTITITDNESTLYFQYPNGQSIYAVTENAGVLPVTIIRQGSLASSATARLTSGQGSSATPGADYLPFSTDLTFNIGESTKTAYIPILNDSIFELDETFPIMLSHVVGANQGSWTTSAKIVDDDNAPAQNTMQYGTLQFSSAAYSVDENGGAIQISVSRTGGADGTVAVQFSTSDGAPGLNSNQYAWSGSQYGSVNGTLTFGPGETSKTFTVPIYDNQSVANHKAFTVKLRNITGGAQLGTVTQAMVTIIENDSAIEFSQTNYVVSEKSGTLQVRLRRTGSTQNSATVKLNLSSGSATANVDFLVPENPIVSFAPGEFEKWVDLAIVDDSLLESEETFYLSLSNAIGAKLGSSLWGNAKIQSDE